MDSPYSPLTTGTGPPLGHSMSPSGSHSPPLVPIPPPDNGTSYDPHYRHPSSHSQRYDPYSEPAHSRNPSFPPQSAPVGPRRDPYARDEWQQPQQHHYQHQGYHPHAPPPHVQDPYYQADPYYRQPPPRDPYSYQQHAPPPLPRDPYYPPPPRDPYYNHPPPPQARDPYGYPPRGYAPSIPPPPAPMHHVPPPPPIPTGPTAVSLGPHPIHGILTPETDLSIPLLYLARPVSTKTFAPLRQMFSHLELRFVNSLLELSGDLHRASMEDRDLPDEVKEKRRRVWVTAVGGTDALVNRIRASTEEKLEWREIIDLNHLTIELGFEDRRVVELIREREERELRAQEQPEVDEEEEEEREKGRREIERLEKDQNGLDGGQVEELDRVLRAVRGEKERLNEGGGGEYETEPEPTRLGTSRNGERGEAVVDRFEDMVKREHGEGGSVRAKSMDVEEGGGGRGGDGETSRSRKRSRHESEEDHDHSASRAARKKLEAICKAPRRSCVEWANEHSVPITEETRLVDQEPVLGERHRGVWDLFSHELDDISPQIQVLMARALRDVTYPDRLKLYSNPEAFEQLNETVPWFTTLLKTIEARFELVGASSIVPMDPPIAEEPFDELTAESAPPAPPTSADRPDAPAPEPVEQEVEP